MRAVFGLVELDEGAVRWHGATVCPADRARFGYMPEERGLYPRMRVRDQLVYLGQLCGRRPRDVNRSVGAWLERLGLAGRAADRLDALSHGNQQRVQLIAALVNEPDLLVLDEPFSGLDPIAMEAMAGLLSGLAAEGATVLFSSHQLDLVQDLCQDVVIIEHGRIVLAGELAELRAKVPHRFVDIRYRGPAPDWSALAPVTVIQAGDGAGPAAGRRGHRRGRGTGGGPGPRRPRLVQLPASDAVGAVPSGGGGMNDVRQAWLVARREMRERSRSRAFQASVVFLIVGVAAMLILPVLLKPSSTRDVGVTGSAPAALAATIAGQAQAAGITARVHPYASIAAAEQAVRQGHLDVLVADARRLEWKGKADEQLKAVVTGAIQLATIRERAAAAGISPGAWAALMAPAPVTSVELGSAPGRSPGDEAAVLVMTVVLFFGISVFGQMVLTGVLEEKASRVVEVLLARIPPRALLAGKIAGIGLLGLAQIGVTALAALVATAAVRAVDVPAVRGPVLAWALVWFVLGYALYATVYGALGSLGSRVEDAQAVAGPVTVVMVVAYFASFVTIGQPDSVFARAISYFPLTAPMAMPGRIAMGAAAWWEPVVAAALTLAAIAGLVQLAGRVYTRAILHSGPALSLRDIWRGKAASGPGPSGASTREAAPPPQPAGVTAEGRTTMTGSELTRHRWLITILTGTGVVVGVAVAVFTADVIIGVAAGAGFIAVANQMVRLWTRHTGPPVAHR